MICRAIIIYKHQSIKANLDGVNIILKEQMVPCKPKFPQDCIEQLYTIFVFASQPMEEPTVKTRVVKNSCLQLRAKETELSDRAVHKEVLNRFIIRAT